MSRFWKDGANRSGGREFSGMSTTACYLQGEISCTHCHSMHESDPNDQLSLGGISNEACLQCHQAIDEDLAGHTHHAADSSGSQCYNCHMPYTTYGLLKSIRSHWIDSPSVAASVETGRPNACNQCHLDRTLAWTGEALAEWYGVQRVELDEVESVIGGLPGVAEAAAVDVRDDDGSCSIVAAVLLRSGAEADVEQLRRGALAKLPPYAVPERIEVRTELPRTGSGKIDRRALGREYTATV